MSEPRLPLVGVTGRLFPIGRIERVLEPQVTAPTYYVESVNRAGGYGVVLLPEQVDADRAAAIVDRLDGLVLTGGIDVDPAGYGQEPAPETQLYDDSLDAWEAALFDAALAAGQPVLAICRGIQVLNVHLGGTLLQHITDQPGRLPHGIPFGGGGSPVEVTVAPGSRLADALGTTTATGMCHHHQALDRLGRGLTVTATAADGTIEAVELDGPTWVVAVQWHPEDSAMRDPVQQRLFDSFLAQVEAARR